MHCLRDLVATKLIVVQSGIWRLLNCCRSCSPWSLLLNVITFCQEFCRFGLRRTGGWQDLEITISNTLILSPPMRTLRLLRGYWISRFRKLAAMTGWFWEP